MKSACNLFLISTNRRLNLGLITVITFFLKFIPVYFSLSLAYIYIYIYIYITHTNLTFFFQGMDWQSCCHVLVSYCNIYVDNAVIRTRGSGSNCCGGTASDEYGRKSLGCPKCSFCRPGISPRCKYYSAEISIFASCHPSPGKLYHLKISIFWGSNAFFLSLRNCFCICGV